MTEIIAQFLGLRNVQRPERQPLGTLLSASNVYIDDTGAIETITGYKNIISGYTGIIGLGTIGIDYEIGHSDVIQGFPEEVANVQGITDAWEMQNLRYGFFVVNGKLYSRDQKSHNINLVNVSDQVYSWASKGENAWYANNDCGWIENGRTWKPLRLPMPITPQISVINGTLRAGGYQVTQILQHLESGLQSPCATSAKFDLPDNSAIIIEVRKQSGYKSLVYVTECNSTVERYLGEAEAGNIVYNGQTLGMPTDPRQIKKYPFPDGPIVGLAWCEGKLFAAKYDNINDVTTIYYSVPFHYTLWDWKHDVFTIFGKVHQLLGIDEGVLIATDRSLILRKENGTKQGELVRLDDYGCLAGRPMDTNTWNHTMVATQRGASVYRPGKGFLEGFNKYRWDIGSSCQTATVDINGTTLSIVLTDDSGTPYNTYGSPQ